MDSSPMTQGAGNCFLPNIMLRVVSLLKLMLRAVGGRFVNAVVKIVLVVAVERVDARINNECLVMILVRFKPLESLCNLEEVSSSFGDKSACRASFCLLLELLVLLENLFSESWCQKSEV